MNMIVTPVNDPPDINIQIPDPYIVNEDFDPVTLDLDDYYEDIDGDDLSYTIQYNENNVQIELTGSIAIISSVENWNGSTNIIITVDDGQARATITDNFTLQVNPVNDEPWLELPAEVSFNEDGSLTFDVNEYAYDVEGDDLSCTISGNTEINAQIFGMTIFFTATADWFGSEIVDITVTDNQARETYRDEMTVTVLAVNDSPEIISFVPLEAEFDTLQYSTVDFMVEVEDIDSTPDYEWRVSGETVGDNQPELSWEFEESGTFTVRVIITDGDFVLRVTWLVYVEETNNEPDDIIPAATAILGNYPNPFNPETKIRFAVHTEGKIKIEVYNSRGQLVKNLVNETYPAGIHTTTWQGRDDKGNNQPSGIYYFRLISTDKNDVQKALLLK
jgi:hypothetical protein